MKRYILTALLGVFGFVGAFASANTVGNFSSDSDICSISFSNDKYFSPSYYDTCGEDIAWYEGNMYGYIDTDGVPFYLMNGFNCGGSETFLVSSVPYSVSICMEDTDFEFCSDSDCNNRITKSGTLYVSTSPITYTPSSSGGGSSGIISGGSTMFGNIINSVSSTIGEFIPYVVQVGVGIISAIIGFVAIKRLMNRIRAKVLSTFNSRKRR